MKTPLWIPSEEKIRNANLTRFLTYVNKKHQKDFRTYAEIYQWSIENIPDFWARFWEFADIKASRGYDQVVDDVRKMPGAKWFSGARLNFAENLLRHRDDRPAFIFRGETQKKAQMTYAELYAAVARLAHSLRGLGLKPGDRVAGYMPNMMETAIAMLAATSVGAVWSSCATDIGSQAALDRLGQIEPKVLFTVMGITTRENLSAPLEMRRRSPRGFRRSRKSSWPPMSTSRRILRAFPTASGGRISSPGRCNRLWILNSCLPTIPCTSCSPRGPRAGRSVWSRGLPAS
jgi:hypothetical protein